MKEKEILKESEELAKKIEDESFNVTKEEEAGCIMMPPFR